MTMMQYLKGTGVATTMELMQIGKAHPQAWTEIKQYAKDEMASLGLEITG